MKKIITTALAIAACALLAACAGLPAASNPASHATARARASHAVSVPKPSPAVRRHAARRHHRR